MRLPGWLRRLLMADADDRSPRSPRPHRRAEARRRPHAVGEPFWTEDDRHPRPDPPMDTPRSDLGGTR